MTGVLEVAAVVALVGAIGGGGKVKVDKDAREQKVALQLYERFFHADLMQCSPENITVIGNALPQDINPKAANGIKLIETYQKERKQWILGFARQKEYGDDIRTRILEEMKAWLASLPSTDIPAEDVSKRLEFCRQILLRPSVLNCTNHITFIKTIAEVCVQLEGLLKQCVTNQKTAAIKLEHIISLGRDIITSTIPVLLYPLADGDKVLGFNRKDVPALIEATTLRAAARASLQGGDDTFVSNEAQSNCNSNSNSNQTNRPASRLRSYHGLRIDWDTDIGNMVRSILTTDHDSRLDASDDAALQSVVASGPSADPAPAEDNEVSFSTQEAHTFQKLEDEIRQRWAEESVGEETGLFLAFRGPSSRDARESYLNLCGNLDKLVFFLSALRPYHRLASIAGDVAMLRIRAPLTHLVTELDKALVQVRQARLEVMGAAKHHLQELVKLKPGGAGVRWMQGLRHVVDTHLDDSQKNLVVLCTDLRASLSTAREYELQDAARKGIEGVASSFLSADFQARCSMALPDGLSNEMKNLKRLANTDTKALTMGGAPTGPKAIAYTNAPMGTNRPVAFTPS